MHARDIKHSEVKYIPHRFVNSLTQNRKQVKIAFEGRTMTRSCNQTTSFISAQ